MVSVAELRARISGLRVLMERDGVDHLFLTSAESLFYFSGFDSGRLLVSRMDAVLWVKDVYFQLNRGFYGRKGFPLKVRVFKKGDISRAVKARKIRVLYTEDLAKSKFDALRKSLGVKLKVTGIVSELRMVKSGYEVSCLKKACVQAVLGMDKAYDTLKPGVVEIDALAEIEAEIRRAGSLTSPFGGGLLLASGVASANIHARASGKKIHDSSVIVDLGGNFEGYFSDMTRTIPVGRIDGRLSGLMEFVENVELSAVDLIRPGVPVVDVHDFVVGELKKKGFKMHHASGHGVGLEIHEAPYIGPGSKEVFTEGMVFTIEPGVYLPGKYGVRFEDTVLLKKKPKLLTR
ncbi:MAG TPA: aminopeptidase P family protein [Candidatus Altiarchaeales archaeon]|nr:aminopeptidase P family protein [Candidatus Altiarchaeales archaeon]